MSQPMGEMKDGMQWMGGGGGLEGLADERPASLMSYMIGEGPGRRFSDREGGVLKGGKVPICEPMEHEEKIDGWVEGSREGRSPVPMPCILATPERREHGGFKGPPLGGTPSGRRDAGVRRCAKSLWLELECHTPTTTATGCVRCSMWWGWGGVLPACATARPPPPHADRRRTRGRRRAVPGDV